MNFNFYEQHEQNARRTRVMKIILPFIIFFVVLVLFIFSCLFIYNGKITLTSALQFLELFIVWYSYTLYSVHIIMKNPVTEVMNAEHGILVDQAALREVDGAQVLSDIVEELALAYGMKKPAVYIVEDAQQPNAFAVGDEFNSGVAVTRPLLDVCSRSELSGVLGHELAHIKFEDSETMLLFILFTSSLAHVIYISPCLAYFPLALIKDKDYITLLFCILTGIIPLFLMLSFVVLIAGTIARLCALLLRFAVSRTREYDADAMSAKVNQSPEGLIGALNVIEEWQDLQEADSDADAMSANVNQLPESLSKVLNTLKEWWGLLGTDNNTDGEHNDTDDDRSFDEANYHQYSMLYFADDRATKHSFWEFHKLFDDHPTIDDRIARLKQV